MDGCRGRFLRKASTPLQHHWHVVELFPSSLKIKYITPRFETLSFRNSSKTASELCISQHYQKTTWYNTFTRLQSVTILTSWICRTIFNAVHHFVFTTCWNLTWPKPQNQISNAKEAAKISPPPLATEWLFFDFGLWYAPVCGCSVGCLCSQSIMPEDKYV